MNFIVKSIAVILLVFLAGCATQDPVTARLLNNRLAQIEDSAGPGGLEARDIGVVSNYVVLYIPVKIYQEGPAIFVGPKGKKYKSIPTVEVIKEGLGL